MKHVSVLVVARGIALFGCGAALPLPSPAQASGGSPVPDWIATLVQCKRSDLDHEWANSRYASPAGNDSACVVLGRFGAPDVLMTMPNTGSPIILFGYHLRSGIRDSVTFQARKDSTPGAYYRALVVPRQTLGLQPDTGRTGVIIGLLRDSAGAVLLRAPTVCASEYVVSSRQFRPVSCEEVDASGAFRMTGIPLGGQVMLKASCASVGLAPQSLSPSGAVFPTRRGPASIVMLLDTRGCDPRPLRRIVGTFRGHWTSGFETSSFVPCTDDVWWTAADSMSSSRVHGTGAWVASVDWHGPARWPKSAHRTAAGPAELYVRWRGTIVGPGHYGHLGAAPFKLDADSVAEIREPSGRDCK